MLSDLKDKNKLVGIKQCRKAIENYTASIVFIAEDADIKIINEISSNCISKNIQIVKVETMKELGKACGIDVGAAVACLIKS